MKHVVRKPFKEWTVDLTQLSSGSPSTAFPNQASNPINASNANNYVAYIATQDNKLVQAFPFIKDNTVYQIIEPHPVVLYFNGAQFFMKHIDEWKGKLLTEIEKPMTERNTGKELDNIYTFFSNFSMYATFLYNSLETFVNYAIPDTYTFTEKGRRGITTSDKQHIQRHFSTDEKLWTILPDALQKTFDKQREKQLKGIIKKLKDCRDEITHTKHGGENYPNGYKKIFTIALEFDCNTTIDAVAEIINFYEPNLIEECGCGSEH